MSLVGFNIDTRRDGAISPSTPYDSDYDNHPPVSPARPAESLFMSGLSSQNISAAALAQHIHRSHRQGGTVDSSTIDDFATALSTADDQSSLATYTPTSSSSSSLQDGGNNSAFSRNNNGNNSNTNMNTTNIKSPTDAFSRDTIQEEESSSSDYFHNFSTTMSNTINQQQMDSLDAAEKIYGTAKGVWAWGKGVFFVSPFLGMAEGIAGKAVSMTGNSLNDVDGVVVNTLHGLDSQLLNPAVSQILGIVMAVANKAEEMFGPVFTGILKPIGLIKEKAEVASAKISAKAKEVPEMTTSAKKRVVS